MKWLLLVLVMTFTTICDAVQYENLTNGFAAFYKRTDPFGDKREYTFISKGAFTFECYNIDVQVGSNYDFDIFSFESKLAIKIDNHPAINLDGKYSTSLFGSDYVNDTRHFSVHVSDEIINKLKLAQTLSISGNYAGNWSKPKVLSLEGFENSYNKICSQPEPVSMSPNVVKSINKAKSQALSTAKLELDKGNITQEQYDLIMKSLSH